MSRRSARVVLLVLCVLLLAQETPFGSLLFGADCMDTCGDDSPDRCSLGCTSCACSSHGRVMNLGAGQPELARVLLVDFAPVSFLQRTTPRADSIFHVPRRSS